MYFAFHVADSGLAKTFYGSVFGWRFESRGDYHHIVGSSPAGGIVGGGKGLVEASFVVDDIGKVVAAAVERGGAASEPVKSESGWSARVEDGRGGDIEVWQPADGYGEAEPRCGVGDLFYFVVPVADDEAKGFYGDVLGWEFTPGSHPGGWNIVNVAPPGGMFVGGAGATSLYFRVDDVDAAAERVRAAGGTAGEKEPNSAGWHAACVDDQGVSFSVSSLRHP
jgi:predicted enzyme related to lactoylglutathione lyase